MQKQTYDLEDRLLKFAVDVMRLVEELPDNRAGNHVAGQLLRSSTSPLPNHAEAQSAESTNDFIHKFKICLKELRESHRWLRLIESAPLLPAPKTQPLLQEAEELIRIFKASIRTVERNQKDDRRNL